MRCAVVAIALISLASLVAGDGVTDAKKKHHRHHHKHHQAGAHKAAAHKAAHVAAPAAHAAKAVAKAPPSQPTAAVATKSTKSAAHTAAHGAAHAKKVMGDTTIVSKMQKLEAELAAKERSLKADVVQGHLEVNGPLPLDFAARFAEGVAKATGADRSAVKVLAHARAPQAGADVEEVTYQAPSGVVKAVEAQAADPGSKLAGGKLHVFLVAGEPEAEAGGEAKEGSAKEESGKFEGGAPSPAVDIDVEMPYGDLEPFGREDTAQELTESSISESDRMVDQLERAEVAEEKRSVFRALTRLRGAAITSFDGIARSQTGNIDEYNKLNQWRKAHPLHHLADEESDVSKWAFPDNADF